MRTWSLRMWLGLFVLGLCSSPAGNWPPPRRTAEASSSSSTTEPPGLDLTASPASAIAGVVFYNVQEDLVKVDSRGKLGALARRALVHDRQQELHVLPEEGRALPQRPRDEGGRRQVRALLRRQPGDQASLPHAVRGDPRGHRQGRLHDQRDAQESRRDVPLDGGAPGLGDLPARGGGHAQDAAARHRPLPGGRVGARRPHRPHAEQGLLAEGAAAPGQGDLSLHLRPARDVGRPQVGGHRRLVVRHRAGERGRAQEGRTLPGDPRREHQRRHAVAQQL